MTIKRISSALCAMLISLITMTVCAFSEGNTTIAQAYMNGKILDLFVNERLREDTLDIKVSNKAAEIVDCGTLSDQSVAMRTTILVDISTSMPKSARSKVKEFIDYKIENLCPNEQLRLITFGSEIKVLQGFSSDRYDLDKAAQDIEFKAGESAIYDAVYNTIPDLQLIDGDPCYYHTIVMTDGADYTAQGITKEELFMKLQADTYPIDVVCVSKSEPNSQNKDLSALARISNGRYFSLYSETDIAALTSDLSVSNFFWARAEMPTEMLNGVIRQVDISDGNNSTSLDMKMSVADEAIAQESGAESATTESTAAASSPEAVPEEGHGILSFLNNIDTTMLIIIIAAAVILILIVVIIIVAVNSSKKSRQRTVQQPHNNNNNAANYASAETEMLDDSAGEERFTIKISNIAAPNESWTIDVNGEIVIGRGEGCTIRIDEKSVSREQCRILARNTGLVLFNTSGSNPTKLNGMVINSETLLHPADNIHFGRITLRVDYIQKIGSSVPPFSQRTSGNPNSGDTQSLF